MLAVHKSERIFSNHIAHAMAHERQQDLVPELRALERERSAFGIEDGETDGALGVGPEAELATRSRFRFHRVPARRATGQSQRGQPAG
jgi:hypothetical protein